MSDNDFFQGGGGGAQTPDDTMVPWSDHVHPYNFQTASRTTLQFPDYITCSSPVPWLDPVLVM